MYHYNRTSPFFIFAFLILMNLSSCKSTPLSENINVVSLETGSSAITNDDLNKEQNNDSSKSDFLDSLRQKYAHQPTFLQAVEEMAISLQPCFEDEECGDLYKRAFLLMTEPERVISFRVPWMDDSGMLRINRGWRVEFSSVLGPYKGGLRFHPTVDEGILKFLGFEQIFKNALTGLPMGGGKGGSDFNPKGKSSSEIRRFCESFMTELHRYLHPSTDVPAGDIGVGGREIGIMYGQYKRLTNRHSDGVLTGKSVQINGSPLRPEATGYGLVYIAKLAIEDKLNRKLKGSKCALSGSGNVSQYAAEKLMSLGAKVVTMSDSNGVLYFENGMTKDDWDEIVEAKQVTRLRLHEIAHKVSGTYIPNHSPWTVPELKKYDFAFPCATQNEIDGPAATKLVEAGVQGIFEGANLPVTLEGQEVLRRKSSSSSSSSRGCNLIYIPGKAANAGGVGVSGFEMSQNAQHLTWTSEQVDAKLQELMMRIYQQLKDNAGVEDADDGSLESGANVAGFKKVVLAMKELGWVY